MTSMLAATAAWLLAAPAARAEPPASAPAWAKDLDAALARAEADGKLVLVHFTAPWCIWCRRLERETFSDSRVAAFIAQRAVPVKIDRDREPALGRKYQVIALPTLLFLDAKGEEVGRIRGFRPPDAFLEEAGEITRDAVEILRLAEDVAARPGDVDRRVAYARKLAASGHAEQALEVLGDAAGPDPRDPAIARARGDILRSLGRFAEAADAFAAVLAHPEGGSHVPRAALPLALCRLALGDPEAAAEAASKAIQTDDDPARKAYALFVRAYTHVLARRLEGARGDLAEAARIDPEGRWGLTARSILDRLLEIEEIRRGLPPPSKAEPGAGAPSPGA